MKDRAWWVITIILTIITLAGVWVASDRHATLEKGLLLESPCPCLVQSWLASPYTVTTELSSERRKSVVNKGDLVKVRGTERVGVVTREPYTRRFMEEQDWEMVSHGMGHMAGVYATAVEVIFPRTGETRTYRSGQLDSIGPGHKAPV